MGFLVANETHSMMLVYDLYVNQQHNSMVFARDLTDQFSPVPTEGEYIRLFLQGDIDGITNLVTTSATEVRIHEAIYYNRLSLNRDLVP